ncbi:MAG: peptidylprolyl isomerase [Rhodobacteraceae bacterium]|nr:peptidylprolyl isomerase [Paracoccaceae bacterium]MCY4196762.1 peptidylprolyl isomerase [Paracoccaceae bacterium]
MKKLLAFLTATASVSGAAYSDNILVIEVAGESRGKVEIALFSDVAPQHVERITTLATAGEYDGVVFHRVIDGFMAQTGDVRFGDWTNDGVNPRVGTGGSDLPDLPAEFSEIPFTKGTVGMARTQDPNSANSQFFIMFEDAPHLNGQYTVVGQVTSGQDVVDAIKKGPPPNGMISENPGYMERVEVRQAN